ncbi:MAG: TPM domain-containing protein, partial [Terriglobales bacterium]
MDHARGLRSTAIVLGLAAAMAASLQAQMSPARPGQRDFIVDEANLIRPEDRDQIKQVCETLLKEQSTPIVVVTIPSLAKYGGVDIDSYALALFNRWGIGSQLNSDGILLLVSVGDRKARIELGEGYAHTRDETARMIMQEIIVPNFKKGDYSAGI